MLTLLAVAAAAHAAAPAPSVTRRVLPNGLTVLVRQDASVGVVAASLHVRAGSPVRDRRHGGDHATSCTG